MQASTRRALGALVAASGLALVVVGAWVVVLLGPSGEVQFSATSKAPGAIVIPPEVLNAVDAPVRVTATRRDGGAVMLVAGPSGDARAILARSAVSSVSAVHFPSGRVDLNTSGAGPVRDVHTSDVWRLTAKGTNTVALVVDQVTSPETAVVTSGDTKALSEVTVTLTWADRAWFFLALAATTIGAVIAAFALNDLWQGRLLPAPRTDSTEILAESVK